uniref:Ycf20-like protein n=1 Tax=Noccaea caerulescens TaxID=107243 RepID=A0A1J3HTG7_NOCCA
MGFAITVTVPTCGSEFHLPKRSFRDKRALSLAICLELCSLCHFLHPAQPLLIRHQRRMSWTTIRSSVGGGRFDPPSSSSSNKSSRRPRLIKAIQDLRTKLLVKIQEIKKDLPMKLFFLLVGFYSATAFSTFIGQTGDWDVLSAALAVIVVECIGALMYRASIPLINKMRNIVVMFNFWKTGLALGLFLDSFKF